MHKISYRPEIDGLRGIAIILVLVFHAFPKALSGAFVGVDIFFVISGFLISSIILDNLQTGSFSFADFYSRRIRRIFPALILILAFCLVFGWFFLFASEYEQLAKHVTSSSIFISNFTLLNESGYFDSSAASKPLLHLWSLAIEEQFYIFWPIIIVLFQKRRLKLIIALLVIASFLWNIFLSHKQPAAAFYLPQSRAWELLVGCFLAIIKYEKLQDRNWPSILGAILILIAISVIKKEHYPGAWALLPTIGAALIILSKNSWLNRKVLSNKFLIGVGLISFPLYLWHWPLLSFASIMGIHTPIFSSIIIAISVLLAIFTYKFLEKPIRKNWGLKIKTIILILLMVMLGILGVIAKKTAKNRHNTRDEYIAFFDNSLPQMHYISEHNLAEKSRDDCNFHDVEKYRAGKATLVPRAEISKSCYQRDKIHPKSLFMWGDSHVQHLYPGLKNNLSSDWQILIVASSGCKSEIVKTKSKTNYCVQSNWFALKTIKETKPDVVLIAQLSVQDIKSMSEKVALLKSFGVKKIIFIGQAPQWTNELPKIIARKFWMYTPQRTFEEINEQILTNNSILLTQFKEKALKDAKFIDLVGFLCNEKGCLIRLDEDKKNNIVNWDSCHFSLPASDFVAKNLLIKELEEPDQLLPIQ